MATKTYCDVWRKDEFNTHDESDELLCVFVKLLNSSANLCSHRLDDIIQNSTSI